jgi:hypothetical protein
MRKEEKLIFFFIIHDAVSAAVIIAEPREDEFLGFFRDL